MVDPYLSIKDAGQALRSGTLTSVALTQACLDRIALLDGRLHAFITVAADEALAQAAAADGELRNGMDRGPLHGIPVALKDLFITAGIRTTGHSNLLRDWVPDYDGAVPARLKQAGAVLVGKLALHEFADGGATDVPFPAARNPWNTAFSPAGSSSGSGVALAAGLVLGSVGSDTGFSARGPAAWCNVVALKPTYGLVSRAGAFPLSWSTDHMCPMGRTVEDAALVTQAVAGYDQTDPTSHTGTVPDLLGGLGQGVAGLRIGVPWAWFEIGRKVDADILQAMDAMLATLKGLGCTVHEVPAEALIGAAEIHSVIRRSEGYSYHEHTLLTNPTALGPSLRARIQDGYTVRGQPYLNAKAAQQRTQAAVTALFADVDALVLPVSPRRVPTFTEMAALSSDYYQPPSLCNAFNLTGHPAVSVPSGVDERGLPVGMQVVGPLLRDGLVLRIAHAYEQASPWKDRHPPL